MHVCGLSHLLEESQSDRICRNMIGGTWEAMRPPVPVLREICPVTTGLSITTDTCSGYVVCEIAQVKDDKDQRVSNEVSQADADDGWNEQLILSFSVFQWL